MCFVVVAAVGASALLLRVWSEGASPGSRFSGPSIITVTSFWFEASLSCYFKLEVNVHRLLMLRFLEVRVVAAAGCGVELIEAPRSCAGIGIGSEVGGK